MNRNDLERLLTQDVPCFENKKIWIWGAGDTAGNYQEGLKRIGWTEHIVGYCDKNKGLKRPDGERNTFYGKPVVLPQELMGGYTYLLICSLQQNINREIKAQLKEMGLEGCLIDEAILKTHAQEVLHCYDLLDDEKSKNDYAAVIANRLVGRCMHNVYTENSYFVWPHLTSMPVGKNFVDCGAFTGDTIEKFIWFNEGVVGHIVGFEPDPKNFAAAQNRRERLLKEWCVSPENITLHQAGVGSKTETRWFQHANNNGLGSRFAGEDEGGEESAIVALDDVIHHPVSFLKADIESFEYAMLLGARKTIQQYKPHLCICIYHNAADLFQLILLIKEMVPEYRLAVRQHSAGLLETVLYAWVE